MREDSKDEQSPLVDTTDVGVGENTTVDEGVQEQTPIDAPADSMGAESDASELPVPTPTEDLVASNTQPPAVDTTPLYEPSALDAKSDEAQPVIVSALAPPPKKNKKGLVIGLIVAGALALILGGGALAYNVWYQNPQKVVTDAIVNAITAKTVQATGSLKLENDEYTLSIEASTKTTMDADGQAAIKLTYKADDFAVSVDGEGIYSADGDMYIRVNDLKALVASIEEQSDGQIDFTMFGGVISKVDSKWVKIGKDDLGEFSEEYEKSQKCVAGISKQLDEDASFRRSVEAEIKDLYQEHQFILVGDKLGSRTINGQGSLGYVLDADAELADAFFTGLADTELGSRLEECNEEIAFDEIVSDDAKKDDGTETKAEIWVSRFGHSITELKLTADEDGTKGEIIVNPVFNKEESIEIPTDVITLTELKADIEKALEEYYAEYYSALYGAYGSTEATSTQFN